jgi:hypothetical protein
MKEFGKSEMIKQQIKALKSMKGYSVEAGWFSTARYQAAKGVSPSMVGMPIATIAKINEYGATINRGKYKIIIPPRPFMRLAAKKVKTNIPDVQRKIAKGMVSGKISVKQGLAQIGMFMEGEIVDSIKNGGWTPNAPSTVAKKGFDKPLIDTAQMWQSVSSKVSEPS